jgi:very-short-patch-repair endonuclease
MPMMTSFKNPRGHCQRAKELREAASLPERLLWNALTELKKETGLKFRRQHPLHPYIVDFACIKQRLIIEIDGASHDARLAYDAKRETDLQNAGWKIIRFSNDAVLENLEGVVLAILNEVKQTNQLVSSPLAGRTQKLSVTQ